LGIRISENVVFREMSGEAVLVNLASGTYFGLDGVGTRIWQLLSQQKGKEEVVAALVQEYDVEESKVAGDVDALLQQLLDKGLVRRDA
jgi:hypothetical protein